MTEDEKIVAQIGFEKGFAQGIEAAARITENGHRCRSCGQVFLNDNGHSDADCPKGYSNWDTATDAQKAAAIRALTQKGNK